MLGVQKFHFKKDYNREHTTYPEAHSNNQQNKLKMQETCHMLYEEVNENPYTTLNQAPLTICMDPKQRNINNGIFNHFMETTQEFENCKVPFNIRAHGSSGALQYGFNLNVDLDSELKGINYISDKAFYENYKIHPYECPQNEGLWCNRKKLVNNYTHVGKPLEAQQRLENKQNKSTYITNPEQYKSTNKLDINDEQNTKHCLLKNGTTPKYPLNYPKPEPQHSTNKINSSIHNHTYDNTFNNIEHKPNFQKCQKFSKPNECPRPQNNDVLEQQFHHHSLRNHNYNLDGNIIQTSNYNFPTPIDKFSLCERAFNNSTKRSTLPHYTRTPKYDASNINRDYRNYKPSNNQ
jgi:hypothetical protein